MAAMISIRNLRKVFGPITAVDGVSFDVERGEVLGFLGPNGAGKSTTMKMLCGFLTPTEGRAEVCGHDVVTDSLAARRAIGYLAEGAPAYPDMTPESFLRFIAEIRRIPRAQRRARVERVMRLVHLEGVMRQPIETLSKGYKRRVGLAQALIHDPEVLVMDEPTDGLDPNQKHEVRALIREMAATKAIVLSTHILEEVEAVCSRAVVISRGRVVADGTPEDLQRRNRWHNALRLAVRADAAAVARAVEAAAGVERVERLEGSDGIARCVAFPREGRSIVEPVAGVLRSNGWEVDELRIEEGRLDEVFRDITQGEVPAPEVTA